MSKRNEEINPIEEVVGYFADLEAIDDCRKELRYRNREELRYFSQVDKKIDLIIKIRDLAYSCHAFRQAILFDYTLREIDYMKRYFYKKESYEKIAKAYSILEQSARNMRGNIYKKLRRTYGIDDNAQDQEETQSA